MIPSRRTAAAAPAAGKGAQTLPVSSGAVLAPMDDTQGGRLVSEARAGVTPERPNRWHLFFPARSTVPMALRPRTKSGKPKKLPPTLPPNINERRQMHPMAESRLIEFWRGSAVREVRRQHAMRTLDRARISAIVYRRNMGVADASGDSERLKPLVDGLVSAGVLPDDRRRYVEYGEVEEQRIGYRGPGVLLIVEDIAPAPETPAEWEV